MFEWIQVNQWVKCGYTFRDSVELLLIVERVRIQREVEESSFMYTEKKWKITERY